MEHIDKSDLDQLEQRLSTSIKDNEKRFRKSTSVCVIMSLLAFLLFSLVVGYYLFTVSNRVTNVTSQVRQIPPPVGATPTASGSARVTSSAAPNSDTLNALDARLRSLEGLQDVISSTSRGALEQMYLVFVIVASFFGIFSVFFAYRQIVADGGREKHDEEMRGLVGSFRENITVINGLMTTLEQGFRFRDDVSKALKTIDSQITDFQTYRHRTESNLLDKINSLNVEAFDIARRYIDRDRFKSEENRGKLDNFSINMTTLERMADDNVQFSPFAYFLRALHYFNVTQYDLAEADMNQANKLASREIAKQTDSWYGNVVSGEVIAQIRRMLMDSYYHLGIIYYNLGKYKEARNDFQEAYQHNRGDYRSRCYIPELMFFDPSIPVADCIAEFTTVEQEMRSLSISEQSASDWHRAMASLLMRKGNVFLPKISPLSRRSGYRDVENAERAAELYRQALEEWNLLPKGSILDIFIPFSLGQALMDLGRAEWEGHDPEDLFRQAFTDAQKQIVLKTEPIVLTQLNYALAISAHHGQMDGENPRSYLSRAREHLQHVPTVVRIYSPINKIDLSREEILAEMQIFERNI
jgi:tetratricopeptide (TPR) repeat protein